jgi:hypothetical protein
MLNKTNMAITWAEIIFITLLVVGGIGLWVYIGGRVEADLKATEPMEEYATNTDEVMMAKANLANRQAEFAVLQTEIGKQRTTLEQTAAQIQSMQKANPALASLPGSDMLSPDTLKTYWEAQLQVETLGRQIEELDALIQSLITQKAQLALGLRKLEKDSEPYLVVQEQSLYAESQLAAGKEKMGELRLSLTEQQAQVRTMEELYTELAKYSLVQPTVRYPSSAVLQSYLEARALQEETTMILTALDKQASAKQDEIMTAERAARDAQKTAHSSYLTEQQAFLDGKQARIRMVSGAGILIYLALALGLYAIIASLRKSTPRMLTVLLLSLVPLLILIGYHEFGVMGGVLLSLSVFIALLLLLANASRSVQKGKPG